MVQRNTHISSAGKATKSQNTVLLPGKVRHSRLPKYQTQKLHKNIYQEKMQQSQHANGPELRGSNITLDKITSKTDVSNRRTKISKCIFLINTIHPETFQRRIFFLFLSIIRIYHLTYPFDLCSLYSWTCLLGGRAARETHRCRYVCCSFQLLTWRSCWSPGLP